MGLKGLCGNSLNWMGLKGMCGKFQVTLNTEIAMKK